MCANGRQLDSPGALECSACQAGKYQGSAGACSDCPAGWAQPDQKATKCLQCGSKTSPNFKSAKVIKGETTADTGSTSCSLCDVGKYGPLTGPGTCVECPIGQYEDGKGGLEDALRTCKSCPVDTYSSKEGKSSIADCFACPEKTTTNRIDGCTKESACVCHISFYRDLDSSELVCVACLAEQTNCSVANLTLSTVPAAAGWFRPDVTSTEFFACRDEDCVGGTIDQQCAPGHGGILCAVCDDGFIRQNGVCTSCEDAGVANDGTGGIIIAATVPPFLLFIVLVVYFCRMSKVMMMTENQEKEEEKDMKRTKVKVRPVTTNHKDSKKKNNKKKNNKKKNNKKKNNKTIKVRPAASFKVDEVEENKRQEEKQRAILAALAIQIWWYRTRGKEDSRMRAKHHLAHTARKFQCLLLKVGTNNTAIDIVTQVVEEEVDGRIEESTAEASGNMDGVEIEADTEEGSNRLGSLKDGSFRSLGHRMRILIGYAQITSALVFSFDIPWPPMTLAFLKSLTFINFNFMDFFAPIDPCILYTPFLKQATFHMAILPLCVFVVVSAALVARIGVAGGKSKVIWSKAKSMLVTIVFLLYPGIVTRVFMTFKCQKIGDKRYLVADYSVICGEGEHAASSLVMFVFAFVYVVGIPLGTILILYWNKKLLVVGDDASLALQKKSQDFASVFGALYDAYEPRFWWFEAIIMIQKAMLTGGLVLVAPGSSAQVLVGLIVASCFLIVLMQTKPYEEMDEDVMQTIATVSTCATLLIGFTLKVDRGASGQQAGEYDDAIIDLILIGLFVGVGISGLYMILKSLPWFAAGEDKKEEEKKKEIENIAVDNT
jgi:hypothetical protein